MFEFFRGTVVQATPTKVVVDIGGIGYAIQISLKTFQQLPPLEAQVLLYVAAVIREDEHTLYGFLSLEEKTLFHHLTSVSGVGPKTAVAILGHVDVTDFQLAVLQGNASLLSQIPGIGKKTAQRLLIELKDKFKGGSPSSEKKGGQATGGTLFSDATSALVHLGYHPLEAQKRVKTVLGQAPSEPSLSDLISSALRNGAS